MNRGERVLKKLGEVSKCKGFILPQSLSSFFSRLSFSSHSNSPPPPANQTTNETTPLPSPDDLTADVPTIELKKRIDRYLGGDAEALPFIFEAILARKLSGNHNDTDDELMEEFRSKMSHDNGDEVSNSDEDSSSDDDDLSDESDDDLSD
ncbi:hypothetical protein KSS87_022673 [Heliosperma pusillum]|nr:hypothetical protein KSS87_022673 [Heliosperma pusillum]